MKEKVKKTLKCRLCGTVNTVWVPPDVSSWACRTCRTIENRTRSGKPIELLDKEHAQNVPRVRTLSRKEINKIASSLTPPKLAEKKRYLRVD